MVETMACKQSLHEKNTIINDFIIHLQQWPHRRITWCRRTYVETSDCLPMRINIVFRWFWPKIVSMPFQCLVFGWQLSHGSPRTRSLVACVSIKSSISIRLSVKKERRGGNTHRCTNVSVRIGQRWQMVRNMRWMRQFGAGLQKTQRLLCANLLRCWNGWAILALCICCDALQRNT